MTGQGDWRQEVALRGMTIAAKIRHVDDLTSKAPVEARRNRGGSDMRLQGCL